MVASGGRSTWFTTRDYYYALEEIAGGSIVFRIPKEQTKHSKYAA